MKLLAAFLRLVRWVNLLFIALTQALFQYCIIIPVFEDRTASPALPPLYFGLLCFSSVLIAAAGYIINDYFDLNIDRINKPGKIVVERLIRRRWAIFWHWLLSVGGILLGFFVGWKTGVPWLGPANIVCVAALWFYSTTFKKRLLSGNVLISLLTAWVVLVIGFATHYRIVTGNFYPPAGFDNVSDASKLLRFTFLYAGFAFIICLVREVLKDIEDMRGDARHGCKTMPIVWGVHVSKVFAGTWLVVLTAALLIVFAYMLQFRWWTQLQWWAATVYCLVLIIVPLLYTLYLLRKAQTIADYRRLSRWVKLVMFTGILSMVFF